MQKFTRRAARCTVVAGSAVLALIAIPVASASAAPGDANSSAYGISARNVVGLVNIPATPTSAFPPGQHNSSLPVNLGPLGAVGVLNANTDGDNTTGTSSATGEATAVALLSVGSLPAISADAVRATCTATGSAAPTGASTLVNAKLGGATVINATPAPNTVLLNVPGLAKITLNEQTASGGVLTVNAIHILLGNGALGNVIIGHVSCGPNTPVLGTPILTTTFYGGLGVIAVLAFGAYFVRRRIAGQA